MKLSFTILLLLVVFAVPVFASELLVTTSPESQVIKLNETAVFDITLESATANPEFVEVFTPDVIWDVRLSDSPSVQPGVSKKLRLFLRPLYAPPGIYGIPLYFRIQHLNIEVKKIVFLEIQSLFPPALEYLPAIRVKPSLSSQVDPRNSVTLSVALDNKNKRSGNVTIKVRSTLLNKDVVAYLGGLEKKSVEIPLSLDIRTLPQNDVLRVTVIAENSKGEAYQFDAAPVEYSVIVYEDLVQVRSTSDMFLKSVETITLKNNGNAIFSSLFKEDYSFFSLFTTSYLPSATRESGLRKWQFSLASGDEFVIIKTTSYRGLFVLFILIVIIVTLYYALRSPVVLQKYAQILATREGGISELKIIVVITNRAGGRVKEVTVMDLIPRLALLEKEAEIGSPIPAKVLRNEIRGTLLKWTLGELDTGEQRIIRYRVKSKLSIIEGLTLPPVVAHFHSRGTERTTRSSTSEISLRSK